MNTKFFFNIATWLMLAVSFSSCSEDDFSYSEDDFSCSEDDVSYSEDDFSCSEDDMNPEIIGKWKLLSISYPMVGETNDYFQENIVYEFKTNCILTVSGVTTIPLRGGAKIGEHSYSSDKNNMIEWGSDPVLTINGCIWWYSVSSEYLEISQAPLDGAIINFEKIN